MVSTEPQPQYTNAVVLYHWTQCAHCIKLMPEWRRALRQLPASTDVYEIEVSEHRERLLSMGVNIGDGVPRIVVYNHEGDEFVYSGPRTKEALVNGIRTHLITVHPKQIQNRVPVTVLYFRHSCGYCTRFLPTFLRFAAQTRAGDVVAVDTKQHPQVLQALDPPATTVPHVVHFDELGKQTVFKEERTVYHLNKFLDSVKPQPAASPRKNVSFPERVLEGGGRSGGAVDGDTKSRLEPLLDRLQKRAQTTLGGKHTRAFEPENADVCFIGVRTMDTPTEDTVYILLNPSNPPRGRPPVMASIYGSKKNGLSAKIYTRDKDLAALLHNKRRAGFHPVPETNPFVHALREFGYHVELV